MIEIEDKTKVERAATDAIEPTIRDRSLALVADFEHAMNCNAPMSRAMLTELKALLGVE